MSRVHLADAGPALRDVLSDTCLTDLLWEQVLAQPDATAVLDDERSLTLHDADEGRRARPAAAHGERKLDGKALAALGDAATDRVERPFSRRGRRPRSGSARSGDAR
jgi:non-ribosomal peptide synthetase component F